MYMTSRSGLAIFNTAKQDSTIFHQQEIGTSTIYCLTWLEKATDMEATCGPLATSNHKVGCT